MAGSHTLCVCGFVWQDRQQQQDLERRGVRTVTRKSKGGSTRSTEIDRFEVDESSSNKAETMVEVMKRMKAQFKAQEEKKNANNNNHHHHNHHHHHHNNRGYTGSRVRTAQSASSRLTTHNNPPGGGRVQFADQRVWNRDNHNIGNKGFSRGGSQRSRGSSLAGSEDDREDDENSSEASDDHSRANNNNNNYGARTRAPQQLRFEEALEEDGVGHGNDDEDTEQFVGTPGRRIDQAVMDALQISRGRAKKLITAGKVSVDGRRLNPADKGFSLQGGEVVVVRISCVCVFFVKCASI